tara:strand:+ start:438 stop:893 length:456 start_codon:yes stop_codon:yes gene_type:complete
MPKFRIASRGGSTLTKIGAALKGTYSGIVSGGERIKQDAISKAMFENGVYSMESWPLFELELMNANSLMLTVEADIPVSQEFYVSTSLEYKLTKVEFKDPKSGKKGFRIEGLPDDVTIVLTEVPRTKEQEEARIKAIYSTIIASAVSKVKK